ncbi:MAG TPA: tetratricopeptide repeat protein [Candidatus Sulfotelmatobacter sp.]|nr:tetratricopeptide repeat protein [Candidatus Sulfotelmatobacter sp.]
MSGADERIALMLALNAIEIRLASAPNDVTLRFDRARCIEALGREDDALRAYGEVLALEPAHVRAMNAFGVLLLGSGDREAAESVFAHAAACHPDDASSHANLAFTLARRGELASARAHYEAALRAEPRLALAHHGLATVLERLGEDAAARRHRALGLAHRPLTELRYRGAGAPTRLLLLGTAADGNIVTTRLLDDRLFATSVVVVEHYDPAVALPPHDVVFNVIGEADVCARQLDAAGLLLRATSAPIVNPPQAVLATTRTAVARRLGGIPDVRTPRIVPLTRAQLAAPTVAATLRAHGLEVPFLLRAPGFHGGRHFVRVDALGELPTLLDTLPGDGLLALSFLDARAADGLVRKYRVMIADGVLHPLHLALGRQWNLHYFSAEMADVPAHRAQEAAFLADMPGVLGPRVMAALERVRSELGLDYGGIDFGIDGEGRALIFEANATMVVPEADPDPAFAYRRPAAERVVVAVRTMLLARARSGRRQAPPPGR